MLSGDPLPQPLLLALLPEATEGHLTTFPAPNQTRSAPLAHLSGAPTALPARVGCYSPQRPLLSLGTAEGELANNGLLSPGRNQSPLSSASSSPTFLSGLAAWPVPLRRKPELPRLSLESPWL